MNGRRFVGLSIQRNCFQQDIHASEYALAVLKTLALMMVIGFLFYESFWSLVICVPLGIIYFRKLMKECEKEKKVQFRLQFQEALQSISASLNVGYSLENAMKEAKKDLDILYDKESMIQKEFNYMLRQLYLQIPMEQVLEDWAGRVELEEVRSFVNVFSMAKRSGGNMIAIIRSSISQIRDRMEVQREIETILAEKKYEFKVMTMIPFGIIGYMRFSFPEFMRMLYGNAVGVGVMSICLAMYLSAYYLGERIIDIEV